PPHTAPPPPGQKDCQGPRRGGSPAEHPLAPLREVGLLHHATGAVERLPDPDLLAALERSRPHDAAIPAEELPRAMHLAVELEAPVSDRAVVVIRDVGNGLCL